jgi:hypothetical protein
MLAGVPILCTERPRCQLLRWHRGRVRPASDVELRRAAMTDTWALEGAWLKNCNCDP